MNEILEYLDELFPNPRCELNYQKDYELLLAVVLSAQTTDKRVNQVTAVLFPKYPNLEALSQAPLEDVMQILRPIGTFRKKAQFVIDISEMLLDLYDGTVPNNREVLESMPGVGRKTANVVLSNLYDVPCIAVDTHVSRVSKRLKLAYQTDDVLTIEKKLQRKIPKERWSKTHHQLVLFGRYYCKAANPSCDSCQLKHQCRYYKKVYDTSK